MNSPVGRKHFVLQEKGLKRRYRAFSAISPAHHYGAANPISQFSLEAPGAIHEHLELPGYIIEIDRSAQDNDISGQHLGDEFMSHIIINGAFP